MMIRLKTLLTEISMTGLTPYATSFTWRLFSNSHMYDTKVTIDSAVLNMTMVRDDPYSETSQHGHFHSFYQINIIQDALHINAIDADAPADTSYLRIMLTCAYAIRDFADTYAADQIDVSGFDSGAGKSAQKTRIYHDLLNANQHMFADFKIQKSVTGHLFLIRKQHADSTGIQDTP
jgi:hypothetical protein